MRAASRRWRRRVSAGAIALVAIALAAALAFALAPLPPSLTDYRAVASVRVLDREGGLLRELLSRADGRSVPLAAGEIPAHVRAAFVSAEDKRFFGHLGVSPSAVARALWQDLRARRIVAGGSTITQQLARNLVPRPRTFLGKVQEALWAMRLEAHLSKEEILTQYLNRIPFGNGAFGLEAASQLYFGRKAEHLSVAQAAALASVPRGPTAYDPYRKPERLSARKEWVLGRMRELGFLSAEEAARAAREQLDLVALSRSFRAPHLVDHVAANLDRWGLGEATAVETTLDPDLQEAVEDIVRQEISRLAERRVGSAAALVVDNASGEVLAYAGSADFFDEEHEGQNDGVQMRRQPGSALKPFLYAEAFRAGFTPATVVPDLEAHLSGAQGIYAPKNYDRRLHGPVRVREALANSYNVPAVRVADQLGATRVLQALRRAGFGSLDQSAEHYGAGLVLGNGEVSIWEAARAYSGLSRGGLLRDLRLVRRALRADGSEIPLPAPEPDRRFASPVAAALVTDILSDPSARARAFGLDNALRLPFPSAAKTGTSKGYSDNWTAGFTAERTVAVWAGNFDGTPMVQVSGITGAGPIFRRALTRAMDGLRPAPLYPAASVERAEICPLSGQLAGPSCPSAMTEVFAPGTAPHERCQMHKHLSAELPPELAARCRRLADASGRITDLGADFYEWARSEGLSPEPWLAEACGEALPGGGEAPPKILYPPDGAEFLLIPDLPLADQSIPIRVRARPGEGALRVRVDGQDVVELSPPYATRVAATRGEHTVTLQREGSDEVLSRASFRVRAEPKAGWP